MSDDNGRPHLRLIGQPTTDSSGGDERDTIRTETAPGVDPGRYPAGAWSSLHDLTGRVMLLTGHGDGLDDALATGLADYGARLAIAQRDIERAKLTAQLSSRPGSQGSIAFAMDSTRPEHVRRGIGAVEQLTGQLDALVVVVDLGRATANRDAGSGVSLGEMIHLVRAAERRMAVLGGGRILIVAGGTPRDPAVGAITVGAVTEFVRTTAPGFAAQGVTINGIVAILPVSASTEAESATRPMALTGGGPVPEDTVVGGLGESVSDPASDDPTSALPTPAAGSIARSDEVIDQAPVIPFPAPADGPRPVPTAPTRVQPHDYAAPTVATAILFLSPDNAVLTGQVVRIGG
jgi:NAD(P)-dependent dehydrogenase (short-subunit alcohol dehydrogenase family)